MKTNKVSSFSKFKLGPEDLTVVQKSSKNLFKEIVGDVN